MVSIATLFTLAAAYEEKIEQLLKDPSSARNAQPANPQTRAQQQTTTPPPKPPKKRKTPEPAESTPPTAPANEPAKRGRKAKANPKGGVDEAKAQAEARNARRKRKRVYDGLLTVSSFLGGQAAFTAFFVFMMKSAVLPSRLPKRLRLLAADVIKVILDDSDLCKVVTRELNARRKPPIAKFRFAHLSGVTTSAMDKLRFASNWTPGHSTLAKDIKNYEAHMEEVWCPSGPSASHGTTRTEAEQRADGAAGVAEAAAAVAGEDQEGGPTEAEIDEMMHDVAEPTAREQAEATAHDLEQQALQLLAIEFPEQSEAARLDKWSGGLTEEGVFLGCNVVHIMLVHGKTLVGFCKVLHTKYEVFVDEILQAESERRKGRLAHLFLAVAEMFKKAPRIRLQVKEANGGAIEAYKLYSFQDWKQPTSGQFSAKNYGPDDDCKFMSTTRAALHKAALARSQLKPLDPEAKLFTAAAFPMSGVRVDHVGVMSEEESRAAEEESTTPPEQPEPTEEEEETQEGVDPTSLDMDMVDMEDESSSTCTSSTCNEGTTPSWGVKSVVNAISMMLTGKRLWHYSK